MKLNLFGDICLHDIDWRTFVIDEKLRTLMCDGANVGNLENPITDADYRKPMQVANLYSCRESLAVLQGFDAVSLANNHIQDCGEQGCIDTIAALDSAGLRYFGLGRSCDEALAPLILERDGIRLAFFGATRYANASDGYGTAPEDMRKIGRLIGELKQSKCFVIPYFHWGYEYVRIPAPRERKIAQACIDAGADLVVGAHPHIYQAVEKYRGKYIFYSLGNFIFHNGIAEKLAPIPDDKRLRESFIVQVDINQDHSYTTSLHIYETSSEGVFLLDASSSELVRREIEEVSSILYRSKWTYFKGYYRQAVDICSQNAKVRSQFQKQTAGRFRDILSIYTKFNSQDLKNRIASRMPWLFQ